MDNDISHAVEARLAAIEARLDVLDGGVQADNELPDEEDKPGQGPKDELYVEPVKATGSKK